MRNMHLPTVVYALAQLCSAACIPFDQALRHIGETQCVTGKVVRVEIGVKGVRYLDFCEDYRLCPFSVVVFSYDLKNVGDVRELTGKVVEIRGEVKEHDDRAEIILESRSQLGGEAASLPAMPKNFDVEQRGNFSPGISRAHNRTIRKKKAFQLCRPNFLKTLRTDAVLGHKDQKPLTAVYAEFAKKDQTSRSLCVLGDLCG
jgi:hypothetical protein